MRDSSPPLPPASPTRAPNETCKELPAYKAAPTRPGALAGFKRNQCPGEKPTRRCPGRTLNPYYLMLPFGGGLLFHFRHKHTRHFSLHRAQTPHGRPNMQAKWKASLEQRRAREANQSAAVLKPRTLHAQAHRHCPRLLTPSVGRGRNPGSGLLAAVPSGNCSAGAETPLPALLEASPPGSKDFEKTKIRFWCVCT